VKNRFSWRDLIGEPPLCEGGRLASVIFCCDPRVKPCQILDEALKMLGVSKDDFIKVMEKNKVKIQKRDGSCFGNLAFCPSPEKPSKDRDQALLRMGWSLSRYLKYKLGLLKELVPPDKLKVAFTVRVLKQYAIELLDLETRKVCRALALGNIRTGTIMITEVFREQDLSDRQVETVLSQTEYVGVRIPRDIVAELDDLIEKGVIGSRSDGIRRALILYLGALRKSVKQHAKVKQ